MRAMKKLFVVVFPLFRIFPSSTCLLGAMLQRKLLTVASKSLRFCYSSRNGVGKRPLPPKIRGTIPFGGGTGGGGLNNTDDDDNGLLRVQQFAEVERSFTAQDVAAFGALVGDQNYLHQEWNRNGTITTDENFDFLNHPLVCWKNSASDENEIQDNNNSNNENQTSKILVHGMLVSSLFTCLIGTQLPGAVYLKQTLNFKKPVYVDEIVVGRVTLTKIQRKKGKGLYLKFDTIVYDSTRSITSSANSDTKNDICVEGEAAAWLPILHGGDAK